MEAEGHKLRTRNLRKTYGYVEALADASIKVSEGEFLTLLGPSGSGKTTMLMAIAGLNEPDSGDIWIDGKLATHLPSFQRDIGMVFQNYALFPHMTIFENIAFPLQMRKMDSGKIRESVGRVLETVKLPDLANRMPGELSGGQQQRIALARAFVYEPSIILMDEPLGALDKKLRDHLQLEIKHLHGALGITVLYVTHDQEEAMVMSDRICLMNDARIEQIGTPDELYFQPATVFAADFLGESNLMDGTVMKANRKEMVVSGPGETTIRGLHNPELKPGDKCKLMVRPECISVLNGKARSDNSIAGTLKDMIITGAVTKSFIELPGGGEIRTTELTRGPLATASLGQEIKLGWPSERTVILKAADPSS
ncbi:spermidine/putrescine import ATP-binding protein PotA [bacterium BMS3Bbin10]|nr:spermidine/putrescine import ATP-binding protein PotA [bacterium BMS3Bbin10]